MHPTEGLERIEEKKRELDRRSPKQKKTVPKDQAARPLTDSDRCPGPRWHARTRKKQNQKNGRPPDQPPAVTSHLIPPRLHRGIRRKITICYRG